MRGVPERKVIVPSTRSVFTSAPPTAAILPASSSVASGVSGSVPGRSLPSGRMVIGLPVSPETMSGSATARERLGVVLVLDPEVELLGDRLADPVADGVLHGHDPGVDGGGQAGSGRRRWSGRPHRS